MKIAVIGAGSGFTKAFLEEILSIRPDYPVEIRLFDIRPEGIKKAHDYIEALNLHYDLTIRSICSSTRVHAIQGADHVIATFAVDFPDALLRTLSVLQDHGFQVKEGETVTPSAIMGAARHLHPLLEVLEEVKQLTDHAWFHVTSNPLTQIVRGLREIGGYDRVIGHCHGNLHMAKQVADLAGNYKLKEVESYFAVGINHFNHIQKVTAKDGTDLLKKLESISPDKEALWKKEAFCQWKMYQETGILMGHGMWHSYDFLPYANQRMFKHDLLNTWPGFCLYDRGLRAHSSESAWFTGKQKLDETLAKGHLDEWNFFVIMEALSNKRPPFEFWSATLPNNGNLKELPDDAYIELPALVSANKIEHLPVTTKPPIFFINWMHLYTSIHRSTVLAAQERSKKHAIEAIIQDPGFRHCDCSPQQLLEEMLQVNKDLIPNWP